MSDALEKIRRGTDSSGRAVFATRQHFQFYDRVNEHIGGKLVIVQGSWSFADASAGTHSLAMCMDFRRWNLTSDETLSAVRFGRDLGGTMWERTQADGFDSHIHNNLIGDAPAAPLALAQVAQYRQGLNGLANHARDRVPYRPDKITNYTYIEDDMFSDEDRALLQRIDKGLTNFRANEKRRNQEDVDREKEMFSRMVTLLGEQADNLTVLINKTEDKVTKEELRKAKRKILEALKSDPDVTGVDNPSDEAMAEA